MGPFATFISVICQKTCGTTSRLSKTDSVMVSIDQTIINILHILHYERTFDVLNNFESYPQ